MRTDALKASVRFFVLVYQRPSRDDVLPLAVDVVREAPATHRPELVGRDKGEYVGVVRTGEARGHRSLDPLAIAQLIHGNELVGLLGQTGWPIGICGAKDARPQ